MDVKYINPFLNGTLEVLKKMAFVEAFAGKPYTKTDSIANGDVSGIIGITGGAVGSLAISFTQASILAITSTMLGETYKDVCRDVFDTVGELTNMISGVARTHMEREGLTVYAAIPTVVYGNNHVIMHILKSPSIVIPFSTKHGQFFVDVSIKVVDPAEMAAGMATGPVNMIYRGDRPVMNAQPQPMRPQAPPQPQVPPQFQAPPRPQAPPQFQAPPQPQVQAYQPGQHAYNPFATPPRASVQPQQPRPAQPPRPQTQAAPPPPSEPQAPPEPKKPLTPLEKLARAKENLAKLTEQRDETIKLLKEQPFMDYKQRQQLKKLLPVYEEKVRRLKLDIQAIEALQNMDPDDLENPKIGRHYQNYPHGGRQ